MGFKPCKGLNDVWMRRKGDLYEYIGVYVNNLCIVSNKPKEITELLTNTHKFKLKGTGPIKFHLGCDFFRDEDGTLCMAPKKYITKMIDSYVLMFGTKPKTTPPP